MTNEKTVSRNDLPRDSASGESAPHPLVREGVLAVPGEVKLHFGGVLESVSVSWRLTGPAGAPVVVALGGISASRRVWMPDEPRGGWWHEVVGPGLALDTQRFRVLSFDYLGASADTTGPRDGDPFPTVSAFDQAELLLRLVNQLGLSSVRAIVGASYGGMVTLAFGERYPDRVARLIVISAADRAHPMASAWRVVQRRIVKMAIENGDPAKGLELARALAMATYRSPEEFGARFAGAARRTPDDRFVLPVEEYLFARGADYAKSYRPDSFVCLSESIDLHRVDAGRIFAPVTAIAISEDQLVPLADMRAMVARLPNAELHEISSVYGHDAFLKENRRLAPIFANCLNDSQGND
ncbi:MAG: homoserine O-succinyltransferase [Steroidobacteraceae bacterium]|nr:homoserine O-succinyltransferase [Steroidobacteraceae bacterium]